MDIGLKIKELMSKEKLDAPTLARRLGKSKQAVYDMLEKTDLNTSVLRNLAEIFHVPVTFFLTDETTDSEEVASLKKEVTELRLEVERLKNLKLPTTNERALDVSLKFFEAAKEMFTYYNQLEK
jgi:transcriptional regulator with XRE-family HTH domain